MPLFNYLNLRNKYKCAQLNKTIEVKNKLFNKCIQFYLFSQILRQEPFRLLFRSSEVSTWKEDYYFISLNLIWSDAFVVLCLHYRPRIALPMGYTDNSKKKNWKKILFWSQVTRHTSRAPDSKSQRPEGLGPTSFICQPSGVITLIKEHNSKSFAVCVLKEEAKHIEEMDGISMTWAWSIVDQRRNGERNFL